MVKSVLILYFYCQFSLCKNFEHQLAKLPRTV